MNQVNYAAMTDQGLKEYFLSHRNDEAAFQAYMDRLNSRPKQPHIKPDDPDWDIKVKAIIQQKIDQRLG